jgi:hypothetical protein
MSKLPNQKAAAKNAQAYFRGSERDEETAKQIRKKERAADTAKTAKLRQLRLEKEALEKDAADKLSAENGGQPAKPARQKVAARKRTAVRMVY